MRSNSLQLNAAKTEVLWCASSRRQDQMPDAPFLSTLTVSDTGVSGLVVECRTRNFQVVGSNDRISLPAICKQP